MSKAADEEGADEEGTEGEDSDGEGDEEGEVESEGTIRLLICTTDIFKFSVNISLTISTLSEPAAETIETASPLVAFNKP